MYNFLSCFKQLHLFLCLVFIHTSILSCDCRPKGSADNNMTDENTSTTGTSGSITGTGSSGTGGVGPITDEMLSATDPFPGLKALLKDIKDGKPVNLNTKIAPKGVGMTWREPVGLVIDLLISHHGHSDPAIQASNQKNRVKIIHELIARGADPALPKFSGRTMLFYIIDVKRPDLMDALMTYKDELPINEKYNNRTLLEYALYNKTLTPHDPSFDAIIKTFTDNGIK